MNWIGLVIILIFAFIGYIRGIWRVLADFCSLIAASILAAFLSPLMILPLIKKNSLIPRVLHTLSAYVITALILFVLFLIISRILIYLMEKRRKELAIPKKKGWERFSGSVLGGLWGFALIIIILTGILIIGSIEHAVLNTEQKVEEYKQRALNPTQNKPQDSIQTDHNYKFFGNLKNKIQNSFFGSISKKVNPVKDEHIEMFEDLMIILNDPILFKKFKEHEVIVLFSQDPRITKVANDPKVQYLITNQEYYKLLDNAKIASLVEDRELFNQLKKIDFKGIFKEIITSKD